MAFPGAHSSVFEGCGFCRQPAAFLPLCRTLRFSQPRLGGQCSPQLSANPRPDFRSAGVSPALFFLEFDGCLLPVPHSSLFEACGFCRYPAPALPLSRRAQLP